MNNPTWKNVMPCRKCLVSFHILASGSGHARFTVSMNCKIRKEIPGLQDWRMLELSLIWGFRVLLKKVPKSNWKHCLIITRDNIVIQSHKPHPPFILMSTAHLQSVCLWWGTCWQRLMTHQAEYHILLRGLKTESCICDKKLIYLVVFSVSWCLQ